MGGGPPPSFLSVTAWSGGPAGCALGNPKVNDGGSTGGYSAFWAAPSYQSGFQRVTVKAQWTWSGRPPWPAVLAATSNTAHVWMYDGVNANFSTFNDIYNRMLTDGAARNFSTSWLCEETFCYDTADMDTADTIFAAMVGQGWSLTAASGDHGATAACDNNISVAFPASDPNVVGVGGTTMYLGGVATVPQVVERGSIVCGDVVDILRIVRRPARKVGRDAGFERCLLHTQG